MRLSLFIVIAIGLMATVAAAPRPIPDDIGELPYDYYANWPARDTIVSYMDMVGGYKYDYWQDMWWKWLSMQDVDEWGYPMPLDKMGLYDCSMGAWNMDDEYVWYLAGTSYTNYTWADRARFYRVCNKTAAYNTSYLLPLVNHVSADYVADTCMDEKMEYKDAKAECKKNITLDDYQCLRMKGDGKGEFNTSWISVYMSGEKVEDYEWQYMESTEISYWDYKTPKGQYASKSLWGDHDGRYGKMSSGYYLITKPGVFPAGMNTIELKVRSGKEMACGQYWNFEVFYTFYVNKEKEMEPENPY